MNGYLKQYIKLQKPFRVTQETRTVSAPSTLSKTSWNGPKTNRLRKYWWMCTTCWVSKKRLRPALPDRRPLRKKDPQAAGHTEGLFGEMGKSLRPPKPKTPEEKWKEKERWAQLGHARLQYHPDPLDAWGFEESQEGVVCDCCGKTTHIFYTAPFFSVENIAYLCPACIASGEAAPEISWQFSGQLLFGRWRRQSRETG